MQQPKRLDKRYRRGDRFVEPFGSRAWRADGTPFTTKNYEEAGMMPPTKKQLKEFARRDKEGI